jgi:hypothetical protein
MFPNEIINVSSGEKISKKTENPIKPGSLSLL